MANNPPHTRSTTNDDRLSALEVSTHSIRQQVESQKEEFAIVKAGLDALTSAVAQISRALEEKGARLDETNNNGDRNNVSINQNHEIGESSGGQSRGLFSKEKAQERWSTSPCNLLQDLHQTMSSLV
nr:hypothetical protein CFP56_42616 [Quercus suber]